MVDLNELVRKRGLFIDNAATASQNETLIDDGVTREAIELNVIAPLIVEISERDQRIAAQEAQLAERVKVKPLEWVELNEGKAFRALLPVIGSIRIEPYGVCGWWEVLWSMPGQCDKLIPDVFDTPDEAKAAAQADYERRIRPALEATPPAPKVTEAGPVPTHECEFSVGQPVRLANPYAEDDPDRTFYVTGIDWEYRSVVGHGWNITVATAEEIARGYGAMDGFTPSDLTAAQEVGKP